MAVAAALQWALERKVQAVTVKSDSQLAINLLSGFWRPNPAKGYYPAFRGAMRLLAEAERKGIEVRLEWIPRQENAKADFLAKRLAVAIFSSLAAERQIALVAKTC